MKKWLLVAGMSLAFHSSPWAQQSPSYTIEQGTFNEGGNPAPILTSPSYQITLDSIGDGVAAIDLASGSFGLSTGLPSVYPPPGEARNLRFQDRTTLAWSAEPTAGSYNLYRGNRADLPGTVGTKVQTGLTATTTTDALDPSPGQCLIYLVSVSNRLDEEGPTGSNSGGTLRTLGMRKE